MMQGHIDSTVPFYIEKEGGVKVVSHAEWMKHNNIVMKDNSLFDLENKKMSLRIVKLNYSLDLNNKYYKQELLKAEDDVKNHLTL